MEAHRPREGPVAQTAGLRGPCEKQGPEPRRGGPKLDWEGHSVTKTTGNRRDPATLWDSHGLILTFSPKDTGQQTLPGPRPLRQPGGSSGNCKQGQAGTGEPGSCQKPKPTVATRQDHRHRPHAGASIHPQALASTVLPAGPPPQPPPPPPLPTRAAPRLLSLPHSRAPHPLPSSTPNPAPPHSQGQ